MKNAVRLLLSVWLAVSASLPAQGGPAQGNPAQGNPVQPVAGGAMPAVAKSKISDAARAAMTAARESESALKGAEGPARTAALQASALAWSKVATDFAAEPVVAAQAAFRAGEMWQRDSNFAQAETQFLAAAKLDAQRYGQRALLEAADMQRRQKRNEEALASYAQVVTLDASTSRAQEARVWQGRVLQSMGRVDESIGAFRKAVDATSKPRQVMEAANYLAKALILKGDFDNAESALQHADEVVNKAIAADAAQADALHKALDGMTARKALQKARDKQTGAGKDAKALEEAKGGSMPK